MQEESIQGMSLKIGEGHENDQIRVHNISNKDFQTLWGKLPFSIDAGKDRVFPRYIAIKFARELADRLIYAEADRDKKSVVGYMHKKPSYINAILTEVVDYFGGGAKNRTTNDITEEEERTAVTLGDISVLDELGIPRTAIKTSVDDIAANFRQKTKEERVADIVTDEPQIDSIASDVEPPVQDAPITTLGNATDNIVDLVQKAVRLGIDIPQGATVSEVKELIKRSLGL